MDLINKLSEMYNLQDKLNKQTIKIEDWEKGYALNGTKLNWFRYAKIEASELIESFPIKHWKKSNLIDFLNTKIELVDIWHFLLSKLIEIEKRLEKKNNDEFLSYLEYIFKKSFKLNQKKLIVEKDEIKYTIEFEKRLNKFDYSLALDELNDNLDIKTIQIFIYLCCSIGLSFEELYRLYIGKNCLNQFRQDNGYNDGSYIKIWKDNKEDNVIMYEIISSQEEINYTILYKKLDENYKKVLKKEI